MADWKHFLCFPPKPNYNENRGIKLKKKKKKKKGGHAEMSSWQGNVSKNLEGGKKTNKLTLI